MFRIDPTSSTAPYEQLRQQIMAAVSEGTLVAGAKLPTVRRLAADLSIAVNTVARTYRELEADGIVETQGRRGTFVNAHGDVTRQHAQLAARVYADRVRQLDIDPDEALGIVTAALRSP